MSAVLEYVVVVLTALATAFGLLQGAEWLLAKLRESPAGGVDIPILTPPDVRRLRGTSVFLSHSSRDKEFAKKLALALRRAGARVWYDDWEIKVGDSLTAKISEGIESHQYLVVVLSRSSIDSEWVQRELRAALDRELRERQVVVLPALMEDVEIPLFLRDKKWADFRVSFRSGLWQLRQAIRTVPSVGAPPTNEPLARRSALSTLPLLVVLAVIIAAATIIALETMRSPDSPNTSTRDSTTPTNSPATGAPSLEVIGECGDQASASMVLSLYRTADLEGTYWAVWSLDSSRWYPLWPPNQTDDDRFVFTVPEPVCGQEYMGAALHCVNDAALREATQRRTFVASIADTGCTVLSSTNFEIEDLR